MSLFSTIQAVASSDILMSNYPDRSDRDSLDYDGRRTAMYNVWKRGGKQRASRKQDIHNLKVELTMQEAIEGGASKTIFIRRKKTCESCWGTGVDDAKHWVRCNKCKGDGVKYYRREDETFECHHCDGLGSVPHFDSMDCHVCKGDQLLEVTESVLTTVRPDETTVKLIGYGDDDANPFVGAGNAYVTVVLLANENQNGWSYECQNELPVLVYRGSISVIDALCGFNLNILTPDGRTVTVSCKQVVSSPRLIAHLAGEGAILYTGHRGLCRVILQVKWPTELATREELTSIKTEGTYPTGGLAAPKPLLIEEVIENMPFTDLDVPPVRNQPIRHAPTPVVSNQTIVRDSEKENPREIVEEEEIEEKKETKTENERRRRSSYDREDSEPDHKSE